MICLFWLAMCGKLSCPQTQQMVSIANAYVKKGIKMKDKYVEGKVKSSIDEKISEVVRKAKDAELSGMPMLTAIQNEAGDIYRVITVDGLVAYLALVQGIAKLGLTDLHADNLNPGKYDSLFVFKQ
ncbi:TPA: hypothetical protein ACXEL9_004901 [Klebsiella variicola]